MIQRHLFIWGHKFLKFRRLNKPKTASGDKNVIQFLQIRQHENVKINILIICIGDKKVCHYHSTVISCIINLHVKLSNNVSYPQKNYIWETHMRVSIRMGAGYGCTGYNFVCRRMPFLEVLIMLIQWKVAFFALLKVILVINLAIL